MAILTNSGRVAAAESIKARPIHMAWGSGDAGWDVTPVPVSTTDTALVQEIGRRLATAVKYCVADPAGEIIVPTGRFREVATRTNNLFCKFNFDFTDAENATIREVAVIVGTTTKPALPPGQMYFEPADLIDPGLLLVVERLPKFDRSVSVRQSFEFVITL